MTTFQQQTTTDGMARLKIKVTKSQAMEYNESSDHRYM